MVRPKVGRPARGAWSAGLLLWLALWLQPAGAQWFSFSGLGGGAGAFGPAAEPHQHATDELDEQGLETFLQEHQVTAILFYAPWCFYSQQVMPSWDTAAQKLLLHDPPVHLAKIDVHRHRSVGDKYDISAFPSMKLFVEGAAFDYESDQGSQGRGWQQIVKWVNKHIDRDHVLKSGEDVDNYLHDNSLNVVGVFPDGYNSSLWLRATRHFDDVVFAEATGTSIAGEVAEHLARHAKLVCETVDVGQSQGATKEAALPRPRMNCSNQPSNTQRPEWTDRFNATVDGMTLKVMRTDKTDGWQQSLQMKCCDSDTSSKTVHIPVPSIVMFMPHDERYAIYDGRLGDLKYLDRWINARRTPMISHLSRTTADRILDSSPTATPVVFLIRQDGQAKALEDVMREAAKQIRGLALVCFSGTDSLIEKRLLEIAGVSAGSLPVVTLLEVRGQKQARKFRVGVDGLTPGRVVQFVDDYRNRRLKPWLKSEDPPSPAEIREEPVGVLVGSTYSDIVQDETKDVLVDYYAPWCGHCRKFEPHYNALARKLKHVTSLRVMKIDATRNEFEGTAVTAYPAVLLFPAGKPPKRAVTYQGNRSPEDITRFLKEHCTIKFDDRPPPKPKDALEEKASGLLDPWEEDFTDL